jgi:chemotaxis signal transduction protein
VSATIGIAARASELRAAFDRSFAAIPRRETAQQRDFLAVTIGGDRYAIALAEVAGLFVDRTITPVPGRIPALLGVAGFRGAIVPVFDLRTLFGYPGTGTHRWLVLAAAMPVAFAFETFEKYFRLGADAVVPRSGGDASRAFIRTTARAHDFAWPIVDLEAVIQTIGGKRAGPR